jgi:hypothetical protein
VTAYLALWPAHQRAERSGSRAKAQAILARYATGPYARALVAEMRGAWRRHEVAVGHVTDHILHAGVGSSRTGQPIAIIADCQNAVHYGLAHRGRQRIIAGTSGPRHIYLSASLTFTGGRWRVRSIQLLPHVKC